MAEQIQHTGESELGALETVFMRNLFYRENFHRLTTFCLLVMILIGCTVYFAYHLYDTRTRPSYIATRPDGTILRLYPLEEANMTDEQLAEWATKALTSAYSFDFVNYREILNNSRSQFTKRGYDLFIQAVRASNNLDAIINKKFVVRAVPTSPLKVTGKGLVNGRYTWQVELPLFITYENTQDTIKQHIIVTAMIKRVHLLYNHQGLGIENYIVRDAR